MEWCITRLDTVVHPGLTDSSGHLLIPSGCLLIVVEDREVEQVKLLLAFR